MAMVTWSDHALQRMREQTRYIAEQSCSTEIAWKWANEIFDEAEQRHARFPLIASCSCVDYNVFSARKSGTQYTAGKVVQILYGSHV